MVVVLLLHVLIGLAVSWAVRTLISSPAAFPADSLACQAVFQSSAGAAMEMLLARRAALVACATLHLIVMLYVLSVAILAIPFSLILWARHRQQDRSGG